MKKIFLLTICLIMVLPHQLFANKPKEEKKDSVKVAVTFAELDKDNRYSDQLTHADMNVLPIGFKQTVSNREFAIAMSDIRWMENHAEVTLFARMKTAQGKTPLFFAAQGIKLSHDGNIIGDASLILVNDVDIQVNGHTQLKLRGAGFDTKTGRTGDVGGNLSATSVTVDCSGFKELVVSGTLTFSDSFITRVDLEGNPEKEPVSADFHTVIRDWNDMLLDISLPPFQLKGLDGFIFNLTHAIFDFSDFRNSPGILFPEEYGTKYLSAETPEIWRGVYADRLSITLPKEFSKEGKRTSFEAKNLIIDDNGISGIFSAENVLPIEVGSASGWAFSVNKFWIGLEANKITKAGFNGMIGLPVSDTLLLGYNAQILGNNKYQLIVANQNQFDFDCLVAKAHLLPNSYIQMDVENGKFLPKACLNGFLSINSSQSGGKNVVKKMNLDSIQFRELVLQTQAPYLTAGYVGYKGKISMMGFPVSISGLQFTAPGTTLNLGFDLALNLDTQYVSAKTRINIKSKYVIDKGRGRWKFDGMGIDDLELKNCQIAGIMTLNGRLKIMDQHPQYGDGFAGDLSLVFDQVMKGCKINMSTAFGKKDDFRYWFIDGSAEFPVAINIAGPLKLRGFGGGASNRMKRTINEGLGISKTGCGYMPNKGMGLGLKAAVFFTTDGGSLNGDASFEIQFNRSGGVDFIGFYGYAEFMAEIPGLANLEKNLKGRFNELVELEEKFVGNNPAIAEKLKKLKQYEPTKAADLTTGSGSRAVSANFAASVGIMYDFSAATLHANFDVYVNAAGGLLRGTASNNRAGWGVLHMSPQTWYIHIGTPDDRIGLQVGVPGIASVKATAYFMMGDGLPGSPSPPPEVAHILREKRETLDYMRDLNALSAGRGIAFGSSLGFDTGDLRFLILYAKFSAEMGFDIMMRDYGNAQCRGRSGQIGINGWYANGQAYAYLGGELGVMVNLWFTKGKFPIIKGGAAALFQAKLPNPTWFRGNMGVEFSLLGGVVKGDMRFKFTVGDECELMLPGTSPVDVMMISDLSPAANASEVDVFTAPQLGLTMQVQKPFTVDMEDGKKEFRINLNKFVVKDGSKVIDGKISWNKGNTLATFYSHEVLPPNKQLKLEVAVGFEELKNGQWSTVSTSGSVAQETRELSFTTGDAPDHIPLHNIVYSYPMVDQQSFYTGESKTGKGFVQLKTGQEYLFPTNWKYKTVFVDGSGVKRKETPFSYDIGSKRLNYDCPKLSPSTRFGIGFVSEPNASKTAPTESIKETVLLNEDESLVVQQGSKSNIVIQESEGKVLLDYGFVSSNFYTFADKVNNVRRSGNLAVYNGSYIFQLSSEIRLSEPFEEAEVIGTPASNNEPLVKISAVLDDKYYNNLIEPLLYKGYPLNGALRLGRESDLIGIPPVNAFERRWADSGRFPFYYTLPQYYYSDFDELRTKAANLHVTHPALQAAFFPDIISGEYKAKLQYYLPGGEPGKSSVEYKYGLSK